MKFTKRKTFITVITLMTAFAMTCTTAFAAIYRNNAIDENNYQITIRQGYEYGSNNGYTTKVTAERYNDSQARINSISIASHSVSISNSNE